MTCCVGSAVIDNRKGGGVLLRRGLGMEFHRRNCDEDFSLRVVVLCGFVA